MRSTAAMILLVLAGLFAVPAQLRGQIVTFQEGVGAYSGTLDTQLRLASSNFNAATSISLIADSRDGMVSGVTDPPAQILLWFNDIIGIWAGQLPPGMVVGRAELILSSSSVDAQSGGTISLHRLLQDWTEDCAWASCFGGDSVQVDDLEAMATADATFVPNFPNPGVNGTQRRTNDVTAAVQAWLDGAPNFGWVLINSSDDGYRMDSSEHATPANRPLLRVVGHGCPLSFTQLPSNATVGQCGMAVFTVQAQGSQPIRLQWNEDGWPINTAANPSAATSTLTLTNVQESDQGNYTVTAESECASSVTSTAASLTVRPDTQPPTLVDALGQSDGVTINITFSEPMSDGAVDSINYAICNIADPSDCLVLSTPGTFSFDRMTVTLTSTSPRSASVGYEVRAERMADRCGGNRLAPNSTILLIQEFPVLVPDDATPWKYNHEGVDLGTAWRARLYDDSGWSNGYAALGVEDMPPADPALRTLLLLTNANFPLNTARIPTYYFRAHFNFPGDPSAPFSRLKLRGCFDDFAYVYINGVEVYRDGLLGPVGSPELPFASYIGGNLSVINAAWPLGFSYIPLTSVRPGDNVVAVQLRQQNPGSSDIYMALELVAELVQVRPGLCIFLDLQPDGARRVRIVWPCPAGSPSATGFVLESADNLDGPWEKIPGETSPYVIAPGAARQFYRLGL